MRRPNALLATGAVICSAASSAWAGADASHRDGYPITRVPLPKSIRGPGEIATVGGEPWIVAESADGQTSVFHINPVSLQIGRVDFNVAVEQVVSSGHGAWVLGRDLRTDRPTVGYVSRLPSTDLSAKAVPKACETLGPSSVSFRGRLWLDCATSVLQFAPDSREPTRSLRIRGLRSLLATSSGVWAVTGSIVQPISAHSRPLKLPDGFISANLTDKPLWTVRGDVAWSGGLDRRANNVRVRVDLGRRRTRVFRSPAVPSAVGDISYVGKELWLADPLRLHVLRYPLSHPAVSLPAIAIPARRPLSQARSVALTTTPSRAWILLDEPNKVRLFRVRMQASS
jgi:hypothetical protein